MQKVLYKGNTLFTPGTFLVYIIVDLASTLKTLDIIEYPKGSKKMNNYQQKKNLVIKSQFNIQNIAVNILIDVIKMNIINCNTLNNSFLLRSLKNLSTPITRLEILYNFDGDKVHSMKSSSIMDELDEDLLNFILSFNHKTVQIKSLNKLSVDIERIILRYRNKKSILLYKDSFYISDINSLYGIKLQTPKCNDVLLNTISELMTSFPTLMTPKHYTYKTQLNVNKILLQKNLDLRVELYLNELYKLKIECL